MSGGPPLATSAAASGGGSGISGGSAGGGRGGGGGGGGGGGRRGRRGGGRGGGGNNNNNAADNKPKSSKGGPNSGGGGEDGQLQQLQQPSQQGRQQQARKGGGGGGGGGAGGGGRGGRRGGGNNNKGGVGGGGGNRQQQQQGNTASTAAAPPVISEEETKLRNEEKQRLEQAKAEKKRLEEVEKARKAAATARQKQQEVVDKRVKEAKDLIKSVVEITILHKESRASLQPEALAAARKDFEANKKKLVSDFKKCTAFVKKIKSGSAWTAANAEDAIVKDVAVLNLSRYVEEVVSALLESKPKVTDLPAIMAVCKAMYERYPEFLPNLLLPQLWSVINSSVSSNETVKLRRIYLRLVTEFVSCGLVTETKALIKTIAEATGAAKGGGGDVYAVQDAILVVAFTKQAGFEILGGTPKAVREAMSCIRQEYEKRVQFEQQQQQQQQQQQTSSSSSPSAVDAGTSTTASATPVTEPVLASKELLAVGINYVNQMDAILQERAVPPDVVAVFSQHCHGAFRSLSKSLVQTHNGLLKLEKRCEQDRLLSGALTEAREKGLLDARKLKDSLQKSVEALSDVLDEPVPHLAEAEDDADQKEGLGIEVLTKGGGEGGENDYGPFDDEETRAFYCDIPDFLTTIPPAALGLSVEATEAKREENLKKYGSDAVEAEIEEGETSEDDVAANPSEEELEKSAEPEQGEDAASRGENEEGEAGNKDTPHYNLMVLLEQELPECHRREQIDEIAEKFCTKHGSNKNSRKRLASTLFLVPHARLDLLPYYSRMTATLDRIWSDISSSLVTDLEQQFHGQAKFKKNQNLEGRMRTSRYIGELTKFRVAPPIVFLRCLRRCLDDFTGSNVDVVCCLLETCGRYLYRLKHTHARLDALMETMTRLSKAKNLDERLQSLIKGAFYSVKPPPSGHRKQAKEYPPLEAYLRHLLMVRLDPSDEMVAFASRQLARCPWSDPSKQCGALLCRIMLKACRKGRYKTIQAVAAVASSLRSHRSAGEVPIRVVDAVLEELRWALEHPNFRDQQRTITYARLLGELFCRSQVSANVILEQLYEFINLGHMIPNALREASKKLVEAQAQSVAEETVDQVPVYNSAGGISLTIVEDESVEDAELETREVAETPREPKPVAVSQHSKFDPRVISQTDPPNAAYRIKLVCTLLEVSAKHLVSKHNLPRLTGFLAAFQRYLFTKTMLPTDVEFSLLDTFDAIDSQWRRLSKPPTSRVESADDKDIGFPRYSSWIESHNATVATEESEAILEQQKRSHLEALADHSDSSAEPVNQLARHALEDDYISRIEEDDDDSLAKGSVEDELNEDEIDPDADGTVDEGEEDQDDDEENQDDDVSGDADESQEEEDEDAEAEFDEVAYMRQLEEEAFERELRRVQMEALEKGKNASRKIVAGDMISGSQIVKKKPTDGKFPSDSGSQDEPVNALSGKAGIRFQLLKKGNKGKVEAKELVVPTDTNLAMAATRKDDAAAREHREIKQRVLQYSAESAEAELSGGNVYLEHERLQVIRNKPLSMDDIDRNFGTMRGDLQSGQAKSANPQGGGVPGTGRGGRGGSSSGRSGPGGGGRGRGRSNTGGRTLFGS